MSERPTPETDAFSGNMGNCIKFAEKLERERDEAREQANVMHEQWLSKGRCCENLAEELHEVKQQRDEARKKYDTLATEHMLVVNKLCKERDEARAVAKLAYSILAKVNRRSLEDAAAKSSIKHINNTPMEWLYSIIQNWK